MTSGPADKDLGIAITLDQLKALSEALEQIPEANRHNAVIALALSLGHDEAMKISAKLPVCVMVHKMLTRQPDWSKSIVQTNGH